MNNLKFYLVFFFSSLVIHTYSAELIINVKPYKDYKNNEFSLCIKKHNQSSGYYWPYDSIIVNHSGKFEVNNLKTGRYSIAILHPGSEIMLSNIQILKDESVIQMDVELDQVSIPTNIEKIRIVGDYNGFNHWQNYKTLEYDKYNNYWYTNIDSEDFGFFYFIINQNEKTHTPELPVRKREGKYAKDRPWADFHNKMIPGSKRIIFDPSQLNQKKSNPKVSFVSKNAEFHTAFEKVDELIEKISDARRETDNSDKLESYEEFYFESKLKFDDLKNSYQGKYWYLFPHYQILLFDFHPLNLKISQLNKSGKRNLISEIQHREEYIELINEKAIILANLKNDVRMLTPKLIRSIHYFDQYYADHYDIYDKLGIPYGHFKQFLSEVSKTLKDDEIVGETLFLKGKSYKKRNQEKAISIFNDIKNNNPSYSGVINGRVDKELKSLSLAKGIKAPDFEIVTLDGDTITLASLRGKYVFLDFWGTWCKPCRNEIPNIKKLRKKTSKKELEIIGIVCRDNKSKAKKYIKKHKIKYSNSMATNNLMNSYGITSFPTTLLIDKSGVIIAKNLRGDNLVNTIKKKIQ